mgnify:CR=1 FL=1
MRKVWKWAAAAAALLLVLAMAGVAGLTAWTSREVSLQLSELVADNNGPGDLQLRNLNHHTGWLRSDGTVDVVLRDHCRNSDEPTGPALRVRYIVDHLPSWHGPARFRWQADTRGLDASPVRVVLPAGSELSGQGEVDWSGDVSSAWRALALSYAHGGRQVDTQPFDGQLTLTEDRLALRWHLPRATATLAQTRLRLDGVDVDLDLSTRLWGLGDARLAVDRVQSSPLVIEGLALRATTTLKQGRLTSAIRQQAARLQWGDTELRKLGVDASIQNLHAPSVRTVSGIWGQGCGLERLQASEQDHLRRAIVRLLNAGIDLAIERVHGESASGQIDGQWALSLHPNASQDAEAVSLSDQLASNGRLAVRGQLVSPDFHASALASGYFTPTPDGMEARFRFERGQGELAGQPRDTGLIQRALAMADQALAALLGPHRARVDDAPFVPGEPPQALPTEPAASAADAVTASG